MPAAGALEVKSVPLVCLQVEGGSLPMASPLLLARMSAAISGLCVGLGFGVCDIFIAALACEPEPLRPTQVPTPARTRATAASTAIQRGRRYHCGSRGPPGDGGGAAAGGPGSPGSAMPYSRRCEAMVPPELLCRDAAWPAPGVAPSLGWPYAAGALGATGSTTGPPECTRLVMVLQENWSGGGVSARLPGGVPVCGPETDVP